MPEPRPFRVYPILAVGLVCFASSPILVRFADEAPGLTIAVWRTVFAVLMLAPIALPRILPEVRTLSRREWGLVAAAGVLLGLHFITWIESLYHTTVASASVLVTTNPIFIAVLGWLVLKERLSRPAVLAIGVGVLGAALIGWGDARDATGQATNPLLGNSLALAAAVLVSVYLLIGRVVRQRSSWLAYVFPLYTVVALTAVAAALLLDAPLFGFDPTFYGICAVMALGPSITGHGSLNYAIRFFPAALLGLLSLLEPVGASVAAYLLFDELPPWLAVGGMVLVLFSVTAALWAGRKRKREPT